MNQKKFLVIDPGSEQSAYIHYSAESETPLGCGFGKIPNDKVFAMVDQEQLRANLDKDIPTIVCEFPQPRGQLASYQLFETVEFIGRLHQYALDLDSRFEFKKVDRQAVKSYVCAGVQRPKDSNVRQALIDKFGGQRAIEKPKCPECKGRGATGLGKSRVTCGKCSGEGHLAPGSLHGVSSDIWAALGVAVTYADTGKIIERKAIKD